jgi:hypothetical protein
LSYIDTSTFAQYGSEMAATPRHGRVRQERATEADFRPGAPLWRPSNTPEVCCPEVLKLEQIAQQFSCTLGNDHRVRLCNGLRTRRKVRGLADDRLFLSGTRTNQVADDNESGGDADQGLQWSTALHPPTASINSSPARTARSASSSCACG